MNKKELDKLWKTLSLATNIDNLDYDEAITIGSVFGQMRTVIEKQQEENERLKQELEDSKKDFAFWLSHAYMLSREAKKANDDENLATNKGTCPFPNECDERFKCTKSSCHYDTCSNGFAYRMS